MILACSFLFFVVFVWFWYQDDGGLHKAQTQVCCAFCALPRSKQLRQPGAWQAHCPGWAMHLMHLPSPSCPISLLHEKGTMPGVLCFSSGSWSQTVTLPASVNCPGSKEDVVIDWQPAHSLVGNAVSGAKIAAAPCIPALAVTLLLLWLQGRRVVNGRRLLPFGIHCCCC